MNIGLRQRLIVLIFSVLLAAVAVIGVYRYIMERQLMLDAARAEGERSCMLMADLAAPHLQRTDIHGLMALTQKFMRLPDIQEITIRDREGRQLIHTAKPDMPEDRILAGRVPISVDKVRLGEASITVFPESMSRRLIIYSISTLVENFFIFVILAVILAWFLTKSITNPVKEVGKGVKEVIDERDLTRRVETSGRGEIAELGNGINYLIERLELFIAQMTDIATRINELGPAIAAEAGEVRNDATRAAQDISEVSSSVLEMSSSIQSFAESAESLSSSAQQTSSAILEMNASNEEVAKHTQELASSVEDVTTSVTHMTESIREIGGHVETLSSASEQTSASAVQIEATVREVEAAAKQSAALSQQASHEARDIGVASIEQTRKAMEEIKDTVTRYSELVRRLGQRSGEIGKILNVIVDVNEKTNLLALNASILAAQAGEHGKGFAVVAEEIKALAYRTAASAKEIGALISAVQKETKDAVTAISESLVTVEEGVNRTREAGAALDTIVQSSTRSAEMAATIERAMTEQSRGIKQVSEAIVNVKDMSGQIKSATNAQYRGTETILRAAEGMRDIARQVRHAMAEQARGGRQIGEASEAVTALASTISTGTREQRQSIARILESMENIRELPQRNVERVDRMATVIETLVSQAELLKRELVVMNVRRDPQKGPQVLLNHDAAENPLRPADAGERER